MISKTITIKPIFSWVGNDLFCGSVFLVRTTSARDDGRQTHWHLEHIAFPDAISTAGWDHWKGEPFELVGDKHEIRQLVESFYETAFQEMEFDITVN